MNASAAACNSPIDRNFSTFGRVPAPWMASGIGRRDATTTADFSGGCRSGDVVRRVGKGVPLHAVPTRLRSFSESACRVTDAAAPVQRQHSTRDIAVEGSFSESACRVTDAAAPVQRQHSTRDIAVEAAMRPIADLGHMPMLHGIERRVGTARRSQACADCVNWSACAPLPHPTSCACAVSGHAIAAPPR